MLSSEMYGVLLHSTQLQLGCVRPNNITVQSTVFSLVQWDEDEDVEYRHTNIFTRSTSFIVFSFGIFPFAFTHYTVCATTASAAAVTSMLSLILLFFRFAIATESHVCCRLPSYCFVMCCISIPSYFHSSFSFFALWI